MRHLRRIVFCLFVLLYVGLCPWLTLYALGYLYRPGTEQGLVQTGLLYVSTVPSGARVYLGNTRYTQTTPALLRGLLPGDYPVKLVLKDHQPWSQVIPIRAAQASVLERVLLLPQTWQPQELIAGPFRDLVPLPGTPWMLLTTGSRLGDVQVCAWRDARVWPLVPPSSPLAEATVHAWTVVPKSPALLGRVDGPGGEGAVWVELRIGRSPIVVDVSDRFPVPLGRVTWAPRHRRRLFVWREGVLDRVEIGSRARWHGVLDQVRGYGLAGGALYALREDGTLLRFDRQQEERVLLWEGSAAARALFGGRGVWSLTPATDDAVVLIGPRGELVVGPPPVRVVERGVRGIVRGPRDQIAVWTRQGVGVLDEAAQGPGDGDAPQGSLAWRWVFREGQDISQVFWVDAGSHLLARDRERVVLLDLAPSGTPRPRLVRQVQRGSDVFYDDGSGQLYFLEAASGALRTLALLPPRDFLPLPEGLEERLRREPVPR